MTASTPWTAAPSGWKSRRDQPAAPGARAKRTCTWVRLRHTDRGRTLCIYNAHLPGRTAALVRGQPRLAASRIVLDHIKAADPSDAIVLIGDFNAGPDAPSRQIFAEVGLRETAALAGNQAAPPTYQFYGLGMGSLDGILVGPGVGHQEACRGGRQTGWRLPLRPLRRPRRLDAAVNW